MVRFEKSGANVIIAYILKADDKAAMLAALNATGMTYINQDAISAATTAMIGERIINFDGLPSGVSYGCF